MVIKIVRAEVDLPGSVLALIKVDKDQLGPFIKRSLAVELYREGRLSLGKAAELAGAKSKWEMLMLLSERGVPRDYTANDAEKDLQTLNEAILISKKELMPLKYRVIVEKDPEDDVYIASVPTLPGCNTFGKTAKEAVEMAKEAAEVYIETLLDLGKEVPTEEGTLEYTIVVEAHA